MWGRRKSKNLKTERKVEKKARAGLNTVYNVHQYLRIRIILMLFRIRLFIVIRICIRKKLLYCVSGFRSSPLFSADPNPCQSNENLKHWPTNRPRLQDEPPLLMVSLLGSVRSLNGSIGNHHGSIESLSGSIVSRTTALGFSL